MPYPTSSRRPSERYRPNYDQMTALKWVEIKKNDDDPMPGDRHYVDSCGNLIGACVAIRKGDRIIWEATTYPRGHRPDWLGQLSNLVEAQDKVERCVLEGDLA